MQPHHPVTPIKYIVIIAIFSLGWHNSKLFAQEKKEHQNVLLHPDRFYKKYFPHLKVKRKLPDSAFIKIYPKYLSIGLHLLSPEVNVDIRSRKPWPSNYNPSSKFRTNVTDVAGFSLSYKLITAGFSYLLKSGMNTHSDYAPSHYSTATIKYNGAAIAFQFKYSHIKGFTDINQSDPITVYRQREDILNREYQVEAVYNANWRKYSYVAPITFSQRQIISSGGFLLKTGAYFNTIKGDSALLKNKQQQYYDNFSNVRTIKTTSIRIAPGLGGNIVFFKRIYLSGAGFISPDLYFYKYVNSTEYKVASSQAFVFVVDGKASLGYQSPRLYTGIRYEAEKRSGNLGSIQLATTYTYVGIEFGYRFNAPKVVKKVYKNTMPPGM